nr:hypothetical protein 3 [San Bernardo virus]AQM55441.1 hypothetical protein 3 [San Bernardo virus]
MPSVTPKPTVRAAVSRPKPTKTPKKKVVPQFDLNKITADITSSFMNGLNKPLVLLTLVVVVALVFTHKSDFSSGSVGKWITDNADKNSFASWVSKNEMKFLGLMIFVPAIVDSPAAIRVTLALACVFWVLLVPQASVFEYAVQAIALHTYFRVRLQNSRFLIILFVAAMYFLGYITVTQPPIAATQPSGETS